MDDLDGLRDSLSVIRSAPSLRVQALEKLRRAIVEGKLAPGSRLVERKLCDLLGVSRTVVREILRQLEAEGWVVNPPYKGPAVATISLDEARQIYEIRAALEGLAARLCATRATDEQIDRLEKVVLDMTEAAKEGDTERHIKLIENFYEVLLEAADNEMMKAYLSSQRSRLARLRSLSLSRPQRASVSIGEKTRLVGAIRARDAARAQQLSEEHIRASADAAFSAFLHAQASAPLKVEARKLKPAVKPSLPRATKPPAQQPAATAKGKSRTGKRQ